MAGSELSWQPSLFATAGPDLDATFAKVERIELDPEAWVDHAAGWVTGSDDLFGAILESRKWGQRSRRMYDRKVLEPRLTAPWNARSGESLEQRLPCQPKFCT